MPDRGPRGPALLSALISSASLGAVLSVLVGQIRGIAHEPLLQMLGAAIGFAALAIVSIAWPTLLIRLWTTFLIAYSPVQSTCVLIAQSQGRITLDETVANMQEPANWHWRWTVRTVTCLVGGIHCTLPRSFSYRLATGAFAAVVDLLCSSLVSCVCLGDATLLFTCLHLRIFPLVFGFGAAALFSSSLEPSSTPPLPPKLILATTTKTTKSDAPDVERGPAVTLLGPSTYAVELANTIMLNESSPSNSDSSSAWGSISASSDGDANN